MLPKSMTRTFENLTAVKAEKARLKTAIDRHETMLVIRWNGLKDPALRRMLIGNTIHNAIGHLGPYKLISGILNADSSGVGGYLGGAMASRAKTFKGRLFALAIGALVPLVLERLIKPERLEAIVLQLKSIWESMVNKIRPEDPHS